MLSILRMLGGALLMAPDNDGAGGSEDDADTRAVRAMQQKLERKGRDEPEPEEERIVVEVGDDRGDDGDDDAPRSRQDRRRERGSLRQENEQLRAELEAARRAPVVQPPPVQQQEPLPTKAEMETYLDGEFAKIQQEQIDLEQTIQAHQAAKTLTPEMLERAKARSRQLKQNEGVLQARWAQVQDGTIMQRFQPPPRQVDPVDAQLAAEFSDVNQDQRGAAFARAYYAKQAASIQLGEREPVSRYELSREAWQAGRAMLQGKTFTRGSDNGRPAPTRESRARYTGMSSSTGAAGGDRTPTRVTISKEEDSMAQARFAHIPDPAKRRQMFVSERNKKASARQRAG